MNRCNPCAGPGKTIFAVGYRPGRNVPSLPRARLIAKNGWVATPARSACFNFISSTFNSVGDAYELASIADRERMLKAVLELSRKLWNEGNRPQALALGVIMLNIESRFVTGDDAAFVKAETDALIKEASS